MPLLRARAMTAEVLVDLSDLAELRAIADGGSGHVAVGALATHHEVAGSPRLAGWACVADAGRQLGDLQVRNAGTLGGSLAQADPAGDWAAVALAVDAVIEVSGAEGGRTVAVDGFFPAPFVTLLGSGDVLTGVRVPLPSPGSGSAYVKFRDGASGWALTGVAAALTVDAGVIVAARLGATGVADVPVRRRAAEALLVGAPARVDDCGAAIAAAAEGVTPRSDRAASGDYRLHLLEVACRRAVGSALARAT